MVGTLEEAFAKAEKILIVQKQHNMELKLNFSPTSSQTC